MGPSGLVELPWLCPPGAGGSWPARTALTLWSHRMCHSSHQAAAEAEGPDPHDLLKNLSATPEAAPWAHTPDDVAW